MKQDYVKVNQGSARKNYKKYERVRYSRAVRHKNKIAANKAKEKES